MTTGIMVILIKVVALVLAVVPHEVAHGYVAWRLGDPTAKDANRLTLNPLAHIDLFGSILLPGLLILTHAPVLLGWAKPVPFNPGYFADPRKGIMKVGAAGPVTNFLLAAVGGLLFRVLAPSGWLALFLVYMCVTNVALGVFNLIPIPPLDGSRVAMGLLPPSLLPAYIRLERFGFIIIYVLLWMGVLDRIIAPASNYILVALLGR